MQYRPEIDGLRAIAVVPVVLFHAGFPAFHGGFVGVDVFFVISGFLITTIIQAEIARGDFSIKRFYERRARRILPALILVSTLCIPAAWKYLLDDEFITFSKSLVFTSLFASNFFFWQQSDYFAAAANLQPLLHTWSLAVEEQFYLLYPLFLVSLARFGPRILIYCLALVCVFSLAAAELISRSDPPQAFFLLHTRGWELGFGAILAISYTHWSVIDGKKLEFVAGAGLLAIVLSIILFDHTTRFPSLAALLPVVGAAMIIAAARPSNFVGKLLGSAPMVGIGLVSYSAYLWHQPLFAFARIRGIDTTWTMLFLTGCSFALAFISWKFIEKPFRERNRISHSNIFRFSAIASCGLLAFGAASIGGKLPPRLTTDTQLSNLESYASYPTGTLYRTGNCLLLKAMDNWAEECSTDTTGILLWGDSHAASLWNGLKNIGRINHAVVSQLTAAGCPPIVGYAHTGYPHCKELTHRALEIARNWKGPIVLHGNWSNYLSHRENIDRLSTTVQLLREKSAKVIVVLSLPIWRPSARQIVTQRGYTFAEDRKIALTVNDRYKLTKRIDDMIVEKLSKKDVIVVPLIARVCKDSPDGMRCPMAINEGGSLKLLQWDYAHLTKEGSDYYAQIVSQAMDRKKIPF